MKSRGYWDAHLTNRISRRRLLASSLAASAAAGFIVACGGSDDDHGGSASGGSGSGGSTGSGTGSGANSSLKKPVDTTDKAKLDGPLVFAINADATGFDPGILSPGANRALPYAMSTLLTIKPGHLEPSDGDIMGDLAMGPPEVSSDGLQLNFKLRPGIKWHPVEPVNGRGLVADDVKYSWDRFVERGNFRALLANAANPAAPITSVTLPDDQTVVMKLNAPLARSVQALLAFKSSGYFFILPKEEGEGKVDLKSTIVGTGPYYLSEYVPSARFVFSRFEDYWDSKNVHFSSVEQPIIPEYATRLAQFKAGAVHENAQPTLDDMLPTHKDFPQINLFDVGVPDQMSFMSLGFGYQGGEQPLRDERVRQALSMSWDRDGFLDIVSNAKAFEDAGLTVENRWHTALSAGFYTGWWLDPKGKDFGENAKYFEHNLEEAKKLLSAAGFANGLSMPAAFVSGGAFGATYERDIDILEGMSAEAGFKWEKTPLTTSEFATKIQFAKPRRNFEGLAYTPSPFTQPDAVERIYSQYHPQGPYFAYFDVNGKGDGSGDPALTDMIDKARVEQDVSKRQSLVKDMQRLIAKACYGGQYPGVSTQFELHWPAVQNVQVFQDDSRPNLYLWLDKTQPPFKS